LGEGLGVRARLVGYLNRIWYNPIDNDVQPVTSVVSEKIFMILDESMQNAIAGGLAIAIAIGAMLMMFTNIWTTKK
jgi:hypothetical protein